MARLKIALTFAAAGLLATTTGCVKTPPQYQGAAPSYRCVGAPEARTSYVGMNFRFAVDAPTEYHRPQTGDLSTASIAE